MNFDITDGVITLGLTTTAIGLGMAWLPLGVIAAGLFMTIIGLALASRARQRQG